MVKNKINTFSFFENYIKNNNNPWYIFETFQYADSIYLNGYIDIYRYYRYDRYDKFINLCILKIYIMSCYIMKIFFKIYDSINNKDKFNIKDECSKNDNLLFNVIKNKDIIIHNKNICELIDEFEFKFIKLLIQKMNELNNVITIEMLSKDEVGSNLWTFKLDKELIKDLDLLEKNICNLNNWIDNFYIEIIKYFELSDKDKDCYLYKINKDRPYFYRSVFNSFLDKNCCYIDDINNMFNFYLNNLNNIVKSKVIH